MNRIALTSSSSVSFLPFANSEKGDPNCGISFSSASCTQTSYGLDCGFEGYHVCSPMASRGLSGIEHRRALSVRSAAANGPGAPISVGAVLPWRVDADEQHVVALDLDGLLVGEGDRLTGPEVFAGLRAVQPELDQVEVEG